jgi:hypothetical protein
MPHLVGFCPESRLKNSFFRRNLQVSYGFLFIRVKNKKRAAGIIIFTYGPEWYRYGQSEMIFFG